MLVRIPASFFTRGPIASKMDYLFIACDNQRRDMSAGVGSVGTPIFAHALDQSHQELLSGPQFDAMDRFDMVTFMMDLDSGTQLAECRCRSSIYRLIKNGSKFVLETPFPREWLTCKEARRDCMVFFSERKDGN